MQAAARAASELALTGVRNVETFRGVESLLVDDGELSSAELEAFASRVLPGSVLPAVAHQTVVAGDERASFETEYGFPIVDAAAGRFVPSAERSVHYPVVAVTPSNETTRAILGFDMRSDRVRLEAAERAVERGAPTLSAPIRLNPSGRLGYFVVAPLPVPNADGTSSLGGFLSGVFTIEDAVAAVRAELPGDTLLTLRDDGRTLIDEAHGGERVVVDIGGRTLEVQADDTTPRNPVAAIVVALTSAALAALVGLATRDSWRHQRSVEALAERLEYKRSRAELLAQVGRDLSAATSRDGVLDIVATKFAQVLGADQVNIGTIECVIVPTPAGGSDEEQRCAGDLPLLPLCAPVPARDAISANDVVLVLDLENYEADRTMIEPMLDAGWRSAAGVPLQGPDGRPTGVLEFLWSSPPPTASLEPTLRTIGELCSQTLARVDAQELLARRSAALSELSGALAAAATSRDIQMCLMSHAAEPVGADHVNFVLHDPASGDLVVQLPSSLDPAVAARYARIDPAADVPAAVTFRTNQAVLIADREDYIARFPGTAPDAEAAGIVASASLPLRRGSSTCVGAIGFSWHRPVQFTEPITSTLSTIADLASQTLERARLWDEQQIDGRRAQALADLGRALAAAGNERDATRIMTDRIGIVVGADFANVGIVEPNGAALRIYQHGAAGDGEYSVCSLDERLPHVDAVRTESPVLLADRSHYSEHYPHLLDDAVASGIHAALFWPLLDDRRDAIGALGFAWTRPTTPEYAELANISTVADLCVRALERARSTDRRVREARASARLAHALTQATSSADVVDAVARRLTSVVDASAAALILPGAPSSAVEDAERTVVVPIATTSGDALGELRVEWSHPLDTDDARTATLETLSGLVSQTLERVRLNETEHEVVASLQHQVLGDPPRLDRLDVAARYRPASRIVSIGGDWYDIIDLPDGRAAFVIGDVVGHGVSAITTMTQIRTTVRGLVRAGTDLRDIFWQASEMLTDGPDMIATAALFVVDRMRTTVEYCSAGHPPAVIRRPDGAIELLDGALQRPLGCSLRHDHVGTADFPDGSWLLLYTDGLIERRAESLSAGISRLCEHVAALPIGGALSDVLGALIAQMLAAEGSSAVVDDDIAAVLVRNSAAVGPNR
jgi:serine phosphatase RsbU (regulator of sigma subunit)